MLKSLKMSKIDLNLFRKKFRGCLIGSLVGDCLGAPYEGDIISAGDKIIIQRYFDKLETADLKGPYREYTDDTAMMKSIAKSLIEKSEIDYTDISRSFVKEYYQQPHRGYGQNVIEVFAKLRKSKFQDIYKPAKEQFNGSGSYGNGGAMRIAPIALFYNHNVNLMIEVARKTTQITHTHQLGVNGAILQCLAVREALNCHPEQKIDIDVFLENLSLKIGEIERENDDGLGLNDSNPFQSKLEIVKQLLKTDYDNDLDKEVIVKLGNSIGAHESVPTAIYCFLRALNQIPTIQSDNIFRRTIQYAIGLGGDTDTIACMAGAIAGAYLSEDAISPNLIQKCELHQEIAKLADDLYESCKSDL